MSETVLRLRLQVMPTLLGPVDRASPYLWLLHRRHDTEAETESSILIVVFLIKQEQWIMSKKFVTLDSNTVLNAYVFSNVEIEIGPIP
jgi:hypothetical protein